MSDKTEFIPPRHIIINNFTYSFKDELTLSALHRRGLLILRLHI